MTSGFLVLCIVILHNLAGMGLGLLAGRIFHVEYDKATALAIEVSMRTAVLLSHLPPQTLLQTHLPHCLGQSSVYGTIFQALYSQVSGAAEGIR